ncbi:MAG: LPS export ABC transporter periplasmic protein LptC [Gemmatimonadota bacterium]|nr:LPS export ABC transporter periplasmic protein LptC [Gemmatimonadota bacterium]
MKTARRRNRTWWGGATTIAALVVVACGNPTENTVAPGEIQEIQADFVTFDMTSYITTGGIRQAKVTADTAYIYNDSSAVQLRGMELIFYDDDGRPRATVTALGGSLDQSTDRMLAQGDVVLLIHLDGRRVESQEIVYDPNQDRLWSDSLTVLTEADGTVTRGSSFRSDMEFRNLRITDIRGGGNIVF